MRGKAAFAMLGGVKPITQHIHGKLFRDEGGDGRTTLLLLNPDPTEITADSLYLRYAFVLLGPEEFVFPAFILDDWGHELRSLDIYEWVRENADHFPRAEIFGYEADGRETQCFVRGLELVVKLPCYVYQNATDKVTEGVRVDEIWLPDASVAEPTPTKPPPELKRPLRSARVRWLRVPSD
ncbi:MAG: hypothetical protein HF973_16430 [Chloroflexi bacterium]|nr:hypothetical protein [Chloroflexota bacterium]